MRALGRGTWLLAVVGVALLAVGTWPGLTVEAAPASLRLQDIDGRACIFASDSQYLGSLLTCPAATAARGAGALPTSGGVAVVTAAQQPVGDEGIRERLERLRAQAAEALGHWRERLDEQLPALREAVAGLVERLREQVDRALGREG